MLANNAPTFLLASPEPTLLAEMEPVLTASGGRVEVVLSAEAALAAMTAPIPPSLALIDFIYDIQPLPGKYPLPGVGPFSLLQ